MLTLAGLGAGALCAGVGGPGSCCSRSAPSGSVWLLASPFLALWGCLGLVVPVPFLQVPRLLWPCAFSDGSSVNGMPYFTFLLGAGQRDVRALTWRASDYPHDLNRGGRKKKVLV